MIELGILLLGIGVLWIGWELRKLGQFIMGFVTGFADVVRREEEREREREHEHRIPNPDMSGWKTATGALLASVPQKAKVD